ncbi:MAG: 60S ribosomal export protein NMD3 [Thermoplasmata archaeon]
MTYCVECGKEGRTYDSLCSECFDKKHMLVRVPENVDITLCAHCGAHQRGANWAHVDRMEAVRHAIEGAVEVDTGAQLDALDVELHGEDERNMAAELLFMFKVDDADFRREGRTRIRLKRGVCDICSRQKGLYFEAILQVRPSEEEELLERAIETVHKEVERMGPEVFISREESMHGGWDFYLGSKAAAKTIAKLLQSKFGGEVTASSTLQGRRDGKDFYRMTYLFRFPSYHAGSVLKVGDRLLQVVSVGPPIVIVDLSTMQESGVPAAKLRSARKADAETLSAIIVSRSETEVQVMDPETMETVTLLRPPGVAEDAEEMKIVRTPDGVFPSYLQTIN